MFVSICLNWTWLLVNCEITYMITQMENSINRTTQTIYVNGKTKIIVNVGQISIWLVRD